MEGVCGEDLMPSFTAPGPFFPALESVWESVRNLINNPAGKVSEILSRVYLRKSIFILGNLYCLHVQKAIGIPFISPLRNVKKLR